MTALRPYQLRALAMLRASYAAGRRAPVLVLPTGGGKTVVAAAVIDGAIGKDRRVLFLAHRQELIQQTAAKLGPGTRVIRAERDTGPKDAPVVVASIQTLMTPRWAAMLPPADLVIVDECHHAAAPTWAALASRYGGAKLLGLTATPQRGDGAALGDVFDDLVVGASVRELTEMGHLVPCRLFAPPDSAEVSGSRPALSPLDAYRRHAGGQRTVVFVSSVEYAEETVDEFNAAGIAAAAVHGGLSSRERASRLRRFRAGELQVVVNVHVLTEGWDDPGCSSVIIARTCDAAATYLQIVGRVLRPAPGKTHATIIDLTNVIQRHGLPDADREYSLTGEAIVAADRPVRQCPDCGAVFLESRCPNGCVREPRALRVRPQSLATREITSSAPRRPYCRSIIARRPGYCSRCNRSYAPGTAILWYPDLHGRGGHPHARCP